ncbi:MAG: hypothetical protein CO030_02480 [Candidatus Magasanikbacteria bacterium CG_4_9_14_0_2_um_filter_42_11]|uniref:DUF559 domain-containing protein n=1 Tax=Candidatus Magasanikbacteria bacterium CG_4_9_14_0_2_um_filter_42_11 TaxID=1974643 RepID=A0A2M8F9Y5_9BACT|nr:MAG: hypothetical protein COU34_05200 [Candidatus Magasanikbacteria bacterium CG10_big_fil_rev_8_21_14_0_10_43_9]PIY92032.1 MAG: hypothetical protein COY70_05375 [Candidatus Magasanikbacteria bacterium CG_4_10_14_0_8_um_filter_42_12]PJC52518.1 MAG: hypothetical protein CO030_02480 [Candidatus Magasanikbacteria bacterium CG_4_9_14_0_2_um_filter_42_11]
MTTLFNKSEYTGRRKKLRRDMPKGEKLLWQHLKNTQLGYKFRRQCSVGPYVADFYCPRLRLVIEVDGLSHYDDEAKIYDLKRDAYMKEKGLTVKRYTGGQVWHELDSVKQDIFNTCIELDNGGMLREPPLTPPCLPAGKAS